MDQVYATIEKIHQGDKSAREQMILDNMGLVVSMVNRFAYTQIDREELIQIGTIGLMKAIDNFNTDYEVCFSTYAVPMICGEIKRFLRDDGPMKVSRSILENQHIITKTRQTYEQKYGKSPSIQELQQLSGLQMDEIILADGINRPVESIYETVYESEGSTIRVLDQIPSKDAAVDESTINKTMLRDAIEGLSDPEQRMIRLRYYEGKTQTEVGTELSMTQVQVSRMEKRALLKMRECM